MSKGRFKTIMTPYRMCRLQHLEAVLRDGINPWVVEVHTGQESFTFDSQDLFNYCQKNRRMADIIIQREVIKDDGSCDIRRFTGIR